VSESRTLRPFTAPSTGVARLPGSKSHVNRVVLCAALADGTSHLSGVLFADDTHAMLDAVTELGATVDADVEERALTVRGVGGRPAVDGRIDARMSGTTGRFVLPVAAGSLGSVTVDGSEQLRSRPFVHQIAALRSMGAQLEELGEPGHLPIRVEGSPLAGGVVSLPGNLSSQFASGLLLAGPLCSDPVRIELTGEIVSRPYLDLTVDVMSSFGVDVERPDERTFAVPPGSYRAADVLIEPDASAASYFLAAAAITGGTVRVEGLDRTSRQGDVAFADVLAQMGAEVLWGDGFIEVTGGRLRGGIYDLRDFSDTAQTLAVVAVFADTPVEITGIGFIRRKETDRIEAMATELRRCGVDIDVTDDGWVIRPDVGRLRGGRVETYDDHRMAMSMALLGLRVPSVEILDPGCVAKTFPDFFEALEALRPSVESAPSVTVVAIDGPAGAGKSTVAKVLAATLGLPHFDTGAMYRAVAAAALRAGVDPTDEALVADVARDMDLRMGPRVLLDGVDATEEIRSPAVTGAVSAVAANSQVRRILVERQRVWAAELGGGVMEGRDIGTVVFPDAVLKAYLTASPEVRAKRRHDEGSAQSLQEIAADIARRDRIDSSRSDSPLQAAPGAIVLDTSELTLDQVVAQLAELFSHAVEGT